MKEALVSGGPKVVIVDSPIPKPSADQVMIKVVYSGCNPKDWKGPHYFNVTANSGDDIAGIIHAVGQNITEFKIGDRVAAFHQMKTPGGSFAEYAVAPGWTTFHLPKNTSFEEAATIPLAAMTAAIGLYSRLRLPNPWEAATTPIPLIVYGASGAVGSYAIKLARASNIHPIIAIAGKGQTYVETLIDRHRGDTIVDYRNGDENVVERIKDALKKAGQDTVSYAFDTISEKGSYQNIIKILKDGGHITLVLPEKDYSDIPKKFTHSVTYVGSAHLDVEEDSWLKEQAKQGIRTGGKHFALVYFRLFGQALQEGWLKGHPYEVVPGGLDGVQTALSNLVAGKASAVKYIFKIADTAGTGSGS